MNLHVPLLADFAIFIESLNYSMGWIGRDLKDHIILKGSLGWKASFGFADYCKHLLSCKPSSIYMLTSIYASFWLSDLIETSNKYFS